MIMAGDWGKEFPGALTVCDSQGIIIYMNDRSCHMYEEEGGSHLIGTNLLDCHPEMVRKQIEDMLRDHTINTYTIEKKGKKKIIYQAPWYQNGQFAGIVEVVLDIPWDIPHFVRD